MPPSHHSDAALEYHNMLGREQHVLTDNQQKAMLLATTRGENDERETEQRDEIEVQSATVENKGQELVKKEDKQQLLTETNR